MRRFLITSPSFKGTIELIFKEDGVLGRIDFMNAIAGDHMARLFIRNLCPCKIDEIESSFANTKAMVVEADYEISFDTFWNAYDKKINRKRAEPLWNKMNTSKKVKAFMGIKAYDKFLERENWRAKADPETYLRNEMWENEWK